MNCSDVIQQGTAKAKGYKLKGITQKFKVTHPNGRSSKFKVPKYGFDSILEKEEKDIGRGIEFSEG